MGILKSSSASYLVCRNTEFLCVTSEHRVLCHHNYGYHIESASEAIWLHNLADQSTMYLASAVLRETLDCFLLNHELIVDLKQKHIPYVLFLSEILPAQSASV